MYVKADTRNQNNQLYLVNKYVLCYKLLLALNVLYVGSWTINKYINYISLLYAHVQQSTLCL